MIRGSQEPNVFGEQGNADTDTKRGGLLRWLCRRICHSAGGAEDVGSIPGSGRSPGGGNGNPLQYSCLENPMDRGAWWATQPIGTRIESDTTEWLIIHAHTYIHTYTHMCTNTYVSTYTRAHAHTYTRAHAHRSPCADIATGGRQPCEDTGRDWRDAATSQGVQAATRSRKRPGTILPWRIKRKKRPTNTLTWGVQLSGLWENRFLLKSLGLWYCVMATLRNLMQKMLWVRWQVSYSVYS